MSENPMNPPIDLDDLPEDDTPEQPVTTDPGYARIPVPVPQTNGLATWGLPRIDVFRKDGD